MAQILLVDDDRTFLNGLKMFFDMEHIQTNTAITVSKAKELLETKDISLICTDWEFAGWHRTGCVGVCQKKGTRYVFHDRP